MGYDKPEPGHPVLYFENPVPLPPRPGIKFKCPRCGVRHQNAEERMQCLRISQR